MNEAGVSDDGEVGILVPFRAVVIAARAISGDPRTWARAGELRKERARNGEMMART